MADESKVRFTIATSTASEGADSDSDSASGRPRLGSTDSTSSLYRAQEFYMADLQNGKHNGADSGSESSNGNSSEKLSCDKTAVALNIR